MTQTDEVPTTTKHDLRALLTLFNKQDDGGNGLITPQQVESIMSAFNIPLQQIHSNKLYTFDDMLSLISITQTPQQPSSYVSAFMKLLAEYQIKSEGQEYFQQAKRTQQRIHQIKQREARRRQQQLKVRQKIQLDRIEKIQQAQMKEFRDAWNLHIEQFQKSSFQLLEQMKDKHLEEIEKEELALRNQFKSSPKYSKKMLELKAKEKNLLKLREYNQVIKTRKAANELLNREERHFLEAQQTGIEKKLKEFRKRQNNAIMTLKDKIYNQRMALVAKRKQDTECLIVRIRNLQSEIKRKMQEEQRKLHDQLREQLNVSSLYSPKK